MTVKEHFQSPGIVAAPILNIGKIRKQLRVFPWWVLGILAVGVLTVNSILTNDSYREAFEFIKVGLGVTIGTTLVAYLIALGLGLLTGLARISNNILLKNLGTFYVECIRGVPMLVLIFFIALVGVPAIVNGINWLGTQFLVWGWQSLGNALISLDNQAIPMNARAIVALAVTYGAFLAEIFRAGIQSIGHGQMEAARAQGMTYGQALRYIILPQAIRNVLPALGNDFVSMLKDSSLVSVLAVRDITQIARLYAGRSFQYQESYITLAVLYLSMTVVLSALVKLLEKRFGSHVRSI